MARRIAAAYQMEPISALASWSRRLAVFSLVSSIVAVVIVRFGVLDFKPALTTFFGALALAGLSILVGLAAFAAIWQNGSRGMSRILLAFLIDAAILAYPAYLAFQYRSLPAIHDITTDPIDPPRSRHWHGFAPGRRQPSRLCRPVLCRTTASRLSRCRADQHRCPGAEGL
jgi:hypothetical protein